ncbi:hypothetical protein MG293_010300 [Ovis ammon polii]|uniref:Chromatin accessibility complex protein 1 n=1 Tax=Ovis ammon polii TaxID=230172 RepID=A0AAD4Y6S5_OVIAM|nr:hypothetical protein MG293_010300 [Ovis ammon polii]
MADVVVGKDKCGEQRLVSLPLSRIRVIMKSSPEVSSINQEALVLTAKATELFVQYLATYSYRHGSGKEKKALTYSDLSDTAEGSETFQFLAGCKHPCTECENATEKQHNLEKKRQTLKCSIKCICEDFLKQKTKTQTIPFYRVPAQDGGRRSPQQETPQRKRSVSGLDGQGHRQGPRKPTGVTQRQGKARLLPGLSVLGVDVVSVTTAYEDRKPT